MGKCCALHPSPRPQRRLNGLQLPLNYQQIIGWFVVLATGALNFAILVEVQFEELKIISWVIFVVLYIAHIISHLAASVTDPSEKKLRELEVYNVPEFDRNVHAHVIENGRCHLCNIDTSSRKTKHCSICNKCVDQFDHHCKWLNNCIGGRNYVAFMGCVTTALMISLCTFFLCVADIVIFFTNPIYLSTKAQNFTNCSLMSNSTSTYCRNSISLLIFLIFFSMIAVAIGCALLHLCCFHVYISMLGVSTYEYVVRHSAPEAPCYKCNKRFKCCRFNILSKFYAKRKPKEHCVSPEDNFGSRPMGSNLGVSNPQIGIENGDANVINFIGILLNSELDKARKMFLYNKNKIHPHEETS